MIQLPIAFSQAVQAHVALERIGKFLAADEVPPPFPVDKTSDLALDMDADFTWESSSRPSEEPEKKEKETKANVIQCDDLLTFRQFSKKGADDVIDVSFRVVSFFLRVN